MTRAERLQEYIDQDMDEAEKEGTAVDGGAFLAQFPPFQSNEEYDAFIKKWLKEGYGVRPTKENPGYEDPLIQRFLKDNNMSREEYEKIIEANQGQSDNSSSDSD